MTVKQLRDALGLLDNSHDNDVLVVPLASTNIPSQTPCVKVINIQSGIALDAGKYFIFLDTKQVT